MKPWLLYHIPKTGGTSLSQHLQREMSVTGDFLSITLEPRPGSFTASQVREMPAEQLAEVRVFQGHGVGRYLCDLLPASSFHEVVVLREPATRIISHFNFRMSPASLEQATHMTFQAFLQTLPPDFMLRFLCHRLGHPVNFRSLDRVIHDLSGIITVTMSEVDQAITSISAALGVSRAAERLNVSGVNFPRQKTAEPDLVEILRKLNPLDAILYEAAVEMAPSSLTRLSQLEISE